MILMIPETIKVYLRPLYVPVANLYYDMFRKPRRYRYLFESINLTHAAKILEVGTWNGERALQMIDTAHKASPESNIAYYGFDLFEQMTDQVFLDEVSKRPPSMADVRLKLEKSGAEIHLYPGNTKDTLPKEILTLPKMDFVFIDGGHHVDTISSDWNAVSKLMHATTIVIFDDYWRNRSDAGCKLLIDSLDRAVYNVEVLPIVDSFDNDEFGRLDISFAKVTLR